MLSASVTALRHHQAVRHEVQEPSEITAGPLHLDLVHREATFAGRSVDLTPKEFELLAYLARHAGKICTRRMILENVWGPGYASELHYLKVHAYRIRRKLGDETGTFLQSDPRSATGSLPSPGQPAPVRSGQPTRCIADSRAGHPARLGVEPLQAYRAAGQVVG
jgi:Transcriptional regulatory protein, C terminal